MRQKTRRLLARATTPWLVEGERLVARGHCWATRLLSGERLLLLARKQYLLALTDRRLLAFERKRRGVNAEHLVLARPYGVYELELVRSRWPMRQVVLADPSGDRLVFEFRPRQHDLARRLVSRFAPRTESTASEKERHVAASANATTPVNRASAERA